MSITEAVQLPGAPQTGASTRVKTAMEIDCELDSPAEVSPHMLGTPLASWPATTCVTTPAAGSRCMARKPRPRPEALSAHLVAESEEPADVPARPQVPRADAPQPSLQSSLDEWEAPSAEHPAAAAPSPPRSPVKHRVTQLLSSALGRTKLASKGVELKQQRSASGWFRKAAMSSYGDGVVCAVAPGPSLAFQSADLEDVDVMAF